jgi:hypothetical protein
MFLQAKAWTSCNICTSFRSYHILPAVNRLTSDYFGSSNYPNLHLSARTRISHHLTHNEPDGALNQVAGAGLQFSCFSCNPDVRSRLCWIWSSSVSHRDRQPGNQGAFKSALRRAQTIFSMAQWKTRPPDTNGKSIRIRPCHYPKSQVSFHLCQLSVGSKKTH